MKRKFIKLHCSAISIIAIILAMLSSQGFSVDESNVSDYVKEDAVSVATFISSNFNQFVSEYNKTAVEGMELYATSIEYENEVYNISDGTLAYYLDFDGDNGYAVVGDDYNLLDFTVGGDIAELRYQTTIYFSLYDGFVYETEDGYAPMNQVFADEYFYDEISYERKYNGQDSEGSGKITNPSAYIKDRYGDGYVLSSSKTLSAYKNVTQNSYNNYSKSGYGEGNCNLSAMYAIMDYMRSNKGMSKLPSGNTTINPTSDSFYSSLIKDGYKAVSKSVPSIYATVRSKAINYGYKASSTAWTSTNMANVYMDVMNHYRYSTNIFSRYAYLVLIWGFDSQVKSEIDAGFPTMWNTARGQYGGHSMIVKAYQIYKKTSRWWIFTTTSYEKLMILNDNHTSADRYFDLDAYGWNLISEGFGTFLKVRNYAF